MEATFLSRKESMTSPIELSTSFFPPFFTLLIDLISGSVKTSWMFVELEGLFLTSDLGRFSIIGASAFLDAGVGLLFSFLAF